MRAREQIQGASDFFINNLMSLPRGCGKRFFGGGASIQVSFLGFVKRFFKLDELS